MSQAPANDNKFYIGLCMAGAVSAGAYTAGVMDYLLEALEEWQKRKEQNSANTPSHEVVIPVIGGASAGGMTGIIAAAALNNPLKPIKEPLDDLMQERPENKFYHSWVDLLGKDMFPMMLDTGDMKNEQIISLLNSSFIDTVADRAIKPNLKEWKPAPPYFDKDLKIFTTLTNLEGFPYNIAMKGGRLPEKYYMAIHNDYACFRLQSNGVTNQNDGWMPLDFRTGDNIEVAKDAAMATGAFPVGLKSRELKRKSSYVNNMLWCRDITEHFPVKEPDCKTLNVDGGVINNEPFDKVRDVLNSITGEDKKKDEKESNAYNNENTFQSTVLMIDPFPSKERGKFKKSLKLLDVVGLTFNAILEQMRAKPTQLANAMDDNCAGQFLITPSRRIPTLNGGEKEVAGDDAIACGALGGFSGFMSKEFRIHDYFLGRFNCELFLRDYFTISEEAMNANGIFKNGYAGINKEGFASKRKEGQYQIIPIFSPHPPDDYFPVPKFSCGKNWPVIAEEKIDAFRPLVKKRVQVLLMNTVKLKGIKKFLVWIGAKVVLNGMLADKAMNTIKKSLNKHEL
ncbi:MAG TPA: patatin-like phospholipase family protein, partial [Flavisolibacter sp.]